MEKWKNNEQVMHYWMDLPPMITVMSSVLGSMVVMIIIAFIIIIVIILLDSRSIAGVVLVAGVWDSLWSTIACVIVETRIGIMIPQRIIIKRLSSWMFRM